MSEPLVCAICLVDGRESMVRRAVASFRAQSYENKRLLILNTSNEMIRYLADGDTSQILIHWESALRGNTIGALRNAAMKTAVTSKWFPSIPEILVTFDSDDVSHPQRVAEQVALLQASGADACGYFEAPFWDTRPGAFCGAWLYRDPMRKYVLGASLAYRRKTWERRPFDDINHGEDARFAARCNTKAVSALERHRRLEQVSPGATVHEDCDPRIICGIHGSNSSPGYDFRRRQQCFTRAPKLDEICRERMRL